MKVTRLQAKDIFSLGEIDINLENKGLCLVSGYSKDENDSNGSGKSSLAHKAITWGIWGETVIGAKADHVIKKGRVHCSVKVDVTTSLGRSYRIIRSRNPNTLTLFLLQGNDYNPVVVPKTMTETQEYINRELGVDFKTWANTNFFGQGRKLNFPELTAANRYQVLEEILPIGKLRQWLEHTTSTLKSLDDFQGGVTRGIAEMQKTIITTTQNRDYAQERFDKWILANDGKITEVQNTIKAHDKGQEMVEGQLLVHSKALEVLDASVNQHKKSKLKTTYMDLKADSVAIEETLLKANKIKSQWGRKLREYQSLKMDVKKLCNFCENPLTDQQVSELEEKQLSINREIDISTDALQKAAAALDYWMGNQTKNREWAIINAEERDEYAFLEGKYSDIQLKVKSLEQQREVKYRCALLDQLFNLHEEVNPHLSTHDAYKIQLSHEVREEDRLLEKQRETRTQIYQTDFWKQGFGNEIRIYLLEQVCTFLNEKANNYMQELGNGQIKVFFSTKKESGSGVKEEFNVAVESESGAGSYSLLSGGEQALTSFAIGLALSDLAATQSKGQCSFMVLDEPFTNLGPTNCERLVQFLKAYSTTKNTILLISNEASLKDLIPNKIEVEKQNGTTRLT